MNYIKKNKNLGTYMAVEQGNHILVLQFCQFLKRRAITYEMWIKLV